MAETKKSVLSDAEKKAMKDLVAERKRDAANQNGLNELLEAVGKLTGLDHELAAKLHELVTSAAPQLQAKTWYGFPAYARDGKIVLFFKPASKFKDRYATLGFEQNAHLDDGTMWPVAWALTAPFTAAQQKQVTELVTRAAG